MADWIVTLAILSVIYRLGSLLGSLTELDVGHGWLRLKFSQDGKRLVETSNAEGPVRKRKVKN